MVTKVSGSDDPVNPVDQLHQDAANMSSILKSEGPAAAIAYFMTTIGSDMQAVSSSQIETEAQAGQYMSKIMDEITQVKNDFNNCNPGATPPPTADQLADANSQFTNDLNQLYADLTGGSGAQWQIPASLQGDSSTGPLSSLISTVKDLQSIFTTNTTASSSISIPPGILAILGTTSYSTTGEAILPSSGNPVMGGNGYTPSASDIWNMANGTQQGFVRIYGISASQATQIQDWCKAQNPPIPSYAQTDNDKGGVSVSIGGGNGNNSAPAGQNPCGWPPGSSDSTTGQGTVGSPPFTGIYASSDTTLQQKVLNDFSTLSSSASSQSSSIQNQTQFATQEYNQTVNLFTSIQKILEGTQKNIIGRSGSAG